MNRARVCLIWVCLVAAKLATGARADASQSTQFPAFKLLQGQLDSDGFPVSGARLCAIGTPSICFQLPSEPYGGSTATYEFGLEPHAQRLQLAEGGSWVLFSAMFSGGGSGWLTRVAILRFTSVAGRRKIEDLLPGVDATNVSEWTTWKVNGASAYPILVHADFLWGQDETHFASHFYKVEAWRFNPELDRYERVIQYKTQRKYGGGDGSPIRVLEPERKEILRRLLAK